MNPMRTIRVVDPTDVLWKRVGAFLIDEVIYLTLVLAAFVVLPGWIGAIVTVLFAAVLWGALFIVVQGVTGATIGKHICGLRVVTAEGHPADTRQSLVRSLAWIVDGFPYLLPLTGYAAAFGDKRAQRLGDRWAGTFVVDRRFVGQAPHAVAFPADGSEPYCLKQRAPYLPTSHANPLKHTVAAAPELTEAPSDPSPRKPSAEPVFDPDIRGYKRWDAVHNTWAVFDEPSRQWVPAPVTLTK